VDIEMVVEIPKGSRNKYEINHETGEIWLDRTLFTATQYPLDYGFFPRTLGEDGDPLDALVLLTEPAVPGCHVHVRPVAVFWMTDEAGPDAKVLCVPADDPRNAAITDMEHLPPFLLEEIGNFFDVYKLLEPGKRTETGGWEGREVAERVIHEAQQKYVPHTTRRATDTETRHAGDV
jgi:inorganic pyrophosphatase